MLRKHPERSESWQAALGFYRDQNNTARQRELAEAWLTQRPDDGQALRAWLDHGGAGSDPRAAAARVEQWASSAPLDGGKIELCANLLQRADGAFADTARRCLADAAAGAAQPRDRERAATLLAATLAQDGDVTSFARAVNALQKASRFAAVLNAAFAMRDDCASRWQVLQLAPWDGELARDQVESWFQAAGSDCLTHAAAREALLRALAVVPDEELPRLVTVWCMRVNGRYGDDHGLGAKMVPVLERRHAASASSATYQALDAAYELADLRDRRAAHVEAWLASGVPMTWSEPVDFLIEHAAQSGDAQRLEKAVRAALATRQDAKYARQLGDLLLWSGRSDDLRALIRDLEASPQKQLGETAHLLRAHLALIDRQGGAVNGGVDAAISEMRLYVDGTQYPTREMATEDVALVFGTKGQEAAAVEAERLCRSVVERGGNLPVGTTVSSCAALLLHEQGAPSAALEAAAARSPDDLRVQGELAYAAERAGQPARAEQAYRRVLGADPQNAAAWMGLGRLAAARHDVPALEALVRASERALGNAQPEIVLALAAAYRFQGQPRRAVEVLEPLRDRLPDYGLAVIALRDAYAALGSAPARTPLARSAAPGETAHAPTTGPSSAPVAAATAVASVATAPPGADERLRAMRAIDAKLLGLDGHVDEPAARAAIEAAAAAGNPYAQIRLGVLQQAGTLGVTADPRRASATVAPALGFVRAAAERGEPYAAYLWGTVLLRGLGVPKQPAAAATFLRQAADHGEPGAWFNLGYMARSGDGAPEDPVAAAGAYRRAAQAGHAGAMNQLARLQLAGPDAVRQPVEGASWLQKSAERGEPDSVSWWAGRLMYGFEGTGPQPEACRTWLEKGVALGQQRSVYDLGMALLVGVGGPRDERRGIALLQQAAAAGTPRAMIQLVWQHALGQGLPRDPRAILDWTERAAALGDDDFGQIFGANPDQPTFARASFDAGRKELARLAGQGDALAGGLLSRLYFLGEGVEQDEKRAVALALEAAPAGSVEAMRTLGWAYREGAGVEADPDAGQLWFKRCAEAGNSYCMMWLSQMLYAGDAGVKDPVTALAWLERSATLGNYWAMHNLARHYDEGGEGMVRDPKKAEYWMRKSAAAGNDEAKGWLRAHQLGG